MRDCSLFIAGGVIYWGIEFVTNLKGGIEFLKKKKKRRVLNLSQTYKL